MTKPALGQTGSAGILECERLGLKDFEGIAAEYDAAVARDLEVDPFCTRSAWIVSYHRAFAPDRRVDVVRSGDSYVVLAEREIERLGIGSEPLESMWGFASPLVGPDAVTLLCERPMAPLILLGIPMHGERMRALAHALTRTHDLRPFDVVPRFVASLDGGVDGFLSRRSESFRRNLRASMRRAASQGIVFERLAPESADQAKAFYARASDVESRSWKAESTAPVHSGPMYRFYAEMLPRLAEQRSLRALVARRDGQDLGYLYGGLIEGHFRGLQFSYDVRERQVGVGNCLQFEMIRWLSEQGALRYDLGSRSAYKRSWSEAGPVSLSILALPLRHPVAP